MDTRFLSKDFLTEFIKIYESLPCLWKVKCEEYSNKSSKIKAYQELVNFCKMYYMDADIRFVKSKIQSLRSSFRKELRKVEASRRAGSDHLYEPALWYYKLLLFTKDQEGSSEGYDNGEQDPSEESLMDAGDDMQPEIECSVEMNADYDKLKLIPDLRRRAIKRRNVEDDYLNTCVTTAYNPICEDEYDLVGRNVAFKLRKMNFLQRIFAESIIQEVLTRGMLNELARNTNLSSSLVSQCNTCASTSAQSPAYNQEINNGRSFEPAS